MMLKLRKVIAMLIIAATYAISAKAVLNDVAEIHGVQYWTEFHSSYTTNSRNYTINNRDYIMDNPAYEYFAVYALERETGTQQYYTINLCQAELEAGLFRFYDGSEIPEFTYPVRIAKRNKSIKAYYKYPRYDASMDTIAQRYPYYIGEVWLEDSVPLKDLPNLRETKYQVVCDMDENVFNDELTFVRTPRYMILRKGMFKDLNGLRTVRIGAAQLVEEFAFDNCSNLETVFFESSPYVRDDAFTNCRSIKRVVMDGKCPAPPADYKFSFPNYNYDNRSPFPFIVYEQATLYVHEDQMEAFRQDKTWGKFKNIRDIEEYFAGVEEINPDTETGYDVYDLSGLRVRSARSGENWREGLPAGVYIVKSTLGTVRKEHIK